MAQESLFGDKLLPADRTRCAYPEPHCGLAPRQTARDRRHKPIGPQQYEDGALLDEHGPSHIETICSYAEGMWAERRTADADDAMRQCARMRAMLLLGKVLLAAFQRTDVQSAEAEPLFREIEQ